LPTSLLCVSSLRNSQSAIFNQLTLKLGLRAYRQPGKSVNTSGLLSLPLDIQCSPQPAVRIIDPYRPSTALQLALLHGDLGLGPGLAANRENVEMSKNNCEFTLHVF
jgi:hypothetical protein